MKRFAAVALAAASLALMGQAKPVLVPDVSARRIEIRYSFTGAQLLLFGAILYPGGRVPERPADIAVVVKGPVEPIVVRDTAISVNASAGVVAAGRGVSPRELLDAADAAMYRAKRDGGGRTSV